MNYAIIPAAGTGTRFGGQVKKQFLELKGRSLLEWVLDEFVESGVFSKIVVCTHLNEVSDRLKSFGVDFIEGGATRFESIKKGFEFLSPQTDDIILIHDAARPVITKELIKQVAQRTSELGAVIPVTALHDTIKEVNGTQVVRTIDRSILKAVQTPQGFKAAYLSAVYDSARGDLSRYTDEAKALEELGLNVYTVPGDAKNIKVTTAEDLKLAEFYLDN